MVSLRNLTIGAGLASLVMVGTAMAQLSDRQAQTPTANTHGAKPQKRDAGGRGGMVRPAAAMAPERIAVEPGQGTRPIVPAMDDPRSVEETTDLPSPADK